MKNGSDYYQTVQKYKDYISDNELLSIPPRLGGGDQKDDLEGIEKTLKIKRYVVHPAGK